MSPIGVSATARKERGLTIGTIRAAVASVVLVLATATSALGAGTSIRLAGPRVNRFQTPFHYVASGFASGAANHVWAWETPATRSCAATYREEIHRGRIFLFLSMSVAHDRGFSFVIRFFVRNRESHRLCAYVVNEHSGATFAHAEASWRNV
jgi:hypothetical protein